MNGGLIVAAPTSGSGKTTIVLGLLRALRDLGHDVQAAKSGPDYIDPRFHEAACGRTSYNIDAWAMTPERLRHLAAGDGLLVVEGAMGLFDGAPPEGRGSTADLARSLGFPVVLVVDAAHIAQSIAPLVAGFAAHDPKVRVAGVILNRVGSDRHQGILQKALAETGVPVLGAVRRRADLEMPSRHLGLVQAQEHADLEAFLARAAQAVVDGIDLPALTALAGARPGPARVLPAGQAGRIAVARDAAFSFIYPHQLDDWRRAGHEIAFFSPLNDEPVPRAERVFLPGGYPELHAARLADARRFLSSLREAAASARIYGECGGYMVLGKSLTDAAGTCHEMAGLLALDTSFAERRLHLGYRTLHPAAGGPPLKGHEFHYATTLRAEGMPLWRARDAEGNDLGPMGLVSGNVSGSFAHVIEGEVWGLP